MKHIKKHLQQLQLNKGSASTAFLGMVVFLVALSIALVSGVGYSPSSYNSGGVLTTPGAGSSQIIVTDTLPSDHPNLQLRTFGIVTNTPPPPLQSNACFSNKFNDEPDIFLASDPPPGGIAVAGGQIRVWVDDGNGGSISDGTVIDPVTGALTPGDRTAHDGTNNTSGYYLWEPAIYLTPITSPSQPGPFAGDVENATPPRPYFPVIAKGKISYADQGNDRGFIQNVPPIDTPVNPVDKKGHGGNIAEYIWDVNQMKTQGGLTPGYYRVQIVIHDGDGDLAINCTTIQL